MKILHVFAIIIMVLSFSACGGSVDSSSAELGSGGEAGVSEVSIGELGGLSGSQFDVTFPKAVAAGSITAENFFAVKVSAFPEDSVAAASEVVLFDDSSLCSPAAALAASRSMSPDGYRVRMVLSQPVDLPDRILFCLGVISYMDGTSSAPLQQYVGRAQDGAAPKVVGIVLQGADNGQLAYAAGRQVSVATGVPIDVAVKVFFSKPLTSSSVNRNTVMLADPNGVRILAALSYDEEWMMASLDPAKDLEAGATYSVKVSPNEAGCNPLRDGLCKVVRDRSGAPMLTSLTKPFTTVGVAWPPCDAYGKGALPSCEAFFGAFDKEALKCVPYEGADPRQPPNGGVGYSYDGLVLLAMFAEDPDPAAALACFVSQASSAQHRAEILAGCVPLDHVLTSFGTCEKPKLALSSESVELNCTAGGSCNTAQVTVTNDGGRTLVWQAFSCDDGGANLCQLITRNPSSGSLASGASSAVTIGASGLPEGNHSVKININDGQKNHVIGVKINVVAGDDGDDDEDPVAHVSTNAIAFTCTPGAGCGSDSFAISNAGGGTLNWSLSCSDGGTDVCSYVQYSPASGSESAGGSSPVSVTSSLPPAGDYSATLSITQEGLGIVSQVSLTITVEVAAGCLSQDLTVNSVVYHALLWNMSGGNMLALDDGHGDALEMVEYADPEGLLSFTSDGSYQFQANSLMGNVENVYDSASYVVYQLTVRKTCDPQIQATKQVIFVIHTNPIDLHFWGWWGSKDAPFSPLDLTSGTYNFYGVTLVYTVEADPPEGPTFDLSGHNALYNPNGFSTEWSFYYKACESGNDSNCSPWQRIDIHVQENW